MKPEELAAYIGAAAWLPQIFSWIYGQLVKPTLHVELGRTLEIGFTSSGPICNIPIAFSVGHKDLIVSDVKLTLAHESGERREFTWHGLAETFSEITDSSGYKQTVSRNQSAPIAIKVATNNLLEKTVRFQDPLYHANDRSLVRVVKELLFHLKRTAPLTAHQDVVVSRELLDLRDFRLANFWWRAGRYEAALSLSSKQRFDYDVPSFVFEISAIDINHLRFNEQVMDVELANRIGFDIPGYVKQNTPWNWVYAARE